MRCFDLGSYFSVACSDQDVYYFTQQWPCSGLRGLRGITFTFDKRNGDLVDIHYRNGNSDQWDGDALTTLCGDAQHYGHRRLAIRLYKQERKGQP